MSTRNNQLVYQQHEVPKVTTPQPSLKSTRTLAMIVALLVAAIALAACGSDEDATQTTDQSAEESTGETTRLWIKPDLVDCEGVAPQKCMEVAEDEAGPYELFYDSIEGYTHNDGTAAVLDVTIEDVEDPPADASSLRYTLVEIVE